MWLRSCSRSCKEEGRGEADLTYNKGRVASGVPSALRRALVAGALGDLLAGTGQWGDGDAGLLRGLGVPTFALYALGRDGEGTHIRFTSYSSDDILEWRNVHSRHKYDG
ncbi:hypothetical protein E2C01_012985 [Portunus trituberculatus]|uniref:Uncharacterized protein n=1 Tax=Portunus trituberculatus TaxID=210409 RepID=A0A5B7DG22_PORTR|nr:hypothetical protein [Portunus trituberculatus]